YPYAGVVQATDGALYGTTFYGGTNFAGTVYRLDLSTGALTTLHSFNYGDGANPFGGLIKASDGFFYGTTVQGGPGGYGTVYRVDAGGAVTVLHGFAYNDGASPYFGKLLEASDGSFYGTTQSGGAIGYGTAYRIDRFGNFTSLHSFTATDGAYPYGSLVQGADGLFYGTTSSGGSGNWGTVYRLGAGGA